MKKFITKLIVLLVIIYLGLLSINLCFGEECTFTWSKNKDDVIGYRFYMSEKPGEYVYGEGCELQSIPSNACPEDPNTMTITVENLSDGTLYFVVTAFDEHGNESGPSNEVCAIIDTKPPNNPNGCKCIKKIRPKKCP